MNEAILSDLLNGILCLYGQNSVSNPAVMVYLYLLNRMTREGKSTIVISDRKLAKAAKVGSGRISEYKESLVKAGLIKTKNPDGEKQEKTMYFLPRKVTPQGSISDPVAGTADPVAGTADPVGMHKVTPQGSISDPAGKQSSDDTYYIKNNIDMNNISSTTTTRARAREEEQEIDIGGMQRQARTQAQTIVQNFFSGACQISRERFCMKYHATDYELRQAADTIAEEWADQGKVHNRPNGQFDFGEAMKHFQIYLPQKVQMLRKQQDQPKDRDAGRRALVDGVARSYEEFVYNSREGFVDHDSDFIKPF